MRYNKYTYMDGVSAARAIRREFGIETAQGIARLLRAVNLTAFNLGYLIEVDIWGEEYPGEWEEWEAFENENGE